MKLIKSSYSIIDLLSVICFLLTFSIPLIYTYGEKSSFFDDTGIVLSLCLCIIVLWILYLAKKNNNQYLVILGWWIEFFVLLRIFTLLYTDYSYIFSMRLNANAADINNALIITIISSVTLALGVCFNSKAKLLGSFTVQYDKRCFDRATIIYLLSLAVHIFSTREIPFLSGLSTIIATYFLGLFNVLVFFAIGALLIWRELDTRRKIIVSIVFLSYILLHTLEGNKSGFYLVLKVLLCLSLVLGYEKIKTKFVVIIIAILPLMVTFFTYGSIIRKSGASSLSSSEKVALVESLQSENVEIKSVMTPVFERIGFFDFTCEMVTKKDYYSQMINLRTELMSIIDNALSPGFDIFGVPKVANMIQVSYDSSIMTAMSKSASKDMDYQSDELTLFGESYLLFIVPFNFVFIFLIGKFFKYCWISFNKRKRETNLYKQSLCLLLFEGLLSSFGIDWFILTLVCNIITYLIFVKFVYKNIL